MKNDEILTYTVGMGWHEKESKAETEIDGALKAAYCDAYRGKAGDKFWHFRDESVGRI